MTQGTHDFADDPRNREILIYVNGAMKRRDEAVVSVFDSGFVLGDGVWEGLRVSGGHPAFLEQHLDRLYEGAKAIALDIGLDRDALTRAIYATLAANNMRDGVHVRLMVTRGVKRTPYQDPRVTIGPATIVIIPEHKNPLPDTLDPHGFVATCNSTHFFIVRKGEVWTSTGQYCLGGITRGNVLAVCRDAGIPAFEKSFSLTDVYGADEAFVTGTFAGVVPVRSIDGRTTGDGRRGPIVERLQSLYRALVARDIAGRRAPEKTA